MEGVDGDASVTTLMRSAPKVANHYFQACQRILEGSELKFTATDVIELCKVAAMDFDTCMRLREKELHIDKISDVVASGFANLSETIKVKR
jgi:hypothetical protein